MNKIFTGAAWLFGSHVDTDIIIPSRFLVTGNETELGAHVFADAAPDFSASVARGDILVAGRNFGCGSSREHAPLAIRGAGIACLVAESYARTFFRNCINRGFFALELPEAARLIRQGDKLEINTGAGTITNLTKGESYFCVPVPAFVQEICERGGLFNFIQHRLNQEAKEKW